MKQQSNHLPHHPSSSIMPSRSSEAHLALDWSSHRWTSSSTSTSNTKHTMSKTKKVAFCAKTMVQVRSHIHMNDFSSNEINQSWYTASEIDDIRREARMVTEWMNNTVASKNENDDDEWLKTQANDGSARFCQRGLEYRTREGARRRIDNKVRARNAILYEQELQRRACIFDTEYMAKIYVLASTRCKLAAQRLGQQDEREVMYARARALTG
jgi:hypothetical protein